MTGSLALFGPLTRIGHRNILNNSIISLLERAIRKRQPLKRHTNALRLVNGLGDNLNGLILEQYNRHFVVQIFEKRWLKEKEVLNGFVKTSCDGEYLIIKDRTESFSSQPDAFKTSIWSESGIPKTIVKENGLNFEVDLNDTLNSGLFLDMRNNRKIIAALACGKKVLNCFAYTCSFGVYCRAAGAKSVVNVDISAKGLSRGRYNYELNGLAATRNEFIRADAVQYLKRAVDKNNRFDLIILDPPSFARYEGGNFNVRKDLSKIIGSAFEILNPGGFLFVATNFSGFLGKDLEDMVRKTARGPIKKIQYLGQAEDFIGSGLMPESHLAALLVKMEN